MNIIADREIIMREHKMHSVTSLMFFLFILVMSLVLTGETVRAASVTWTGCGISKNAFMAEIAAAYEKKTGTAVKLSGGGATKGIRAVVAGSRDMGGSCRHRLGGEKNSHPLEAGADLTMVAWDALVVIVHPDNPVDNISIEKLRDIYNGKITSWKHLGGSDKRIALVSRSGKTSGVGYMFRLLAFNDADYEFKARSLTVKSTGPLERKVEKTPTALAIDGISSAQKRVVKFLSLDGVAPTKENIATGKYPFFRPLYLATGKGVSAEAKKLLEFVLSKEGQDIISNQGTVNLEEGRQLVPLWDARKKGYGL